MYKTGEKKASCFFNKTFAIIQRIYQKNNRILSIQQIKSSVRNNLIILTEPLTDNRTTGKWRVGIPRISKTPLRKHSGMLFVV